MPLEVDGDNGDAIFGLEGKTEVKGDGCGGVNGPDTDRFRSCPRANVGLRGDAVAGAWCALTVLPLGSVLNVVLDGPAERGTKGGDRGIGGDGPETEVLRAWDDSGRFPGGAGARMTGFVERLSKGAGTKTSSSSRSLLDLRRCILPTTIISCEAKYGSHLSQALIQQ